MKQRIEYLDMAKGIGIILVVIGHSTYASTGVITWLASFHMPLFFIISGMLIWHIQEEQRDYIQVIKQKATRIMVPYITFSIIFIIIALLRSWFGRALITNEELWDLIYKSIALQGISVLWFLPVLFGGEIIFIGVRKLMKYKDGITIIIVLLLGVLPIVLKPVIYNTLSESESQVLIGVYYIINVLLRSCVALVFITIGYYSKKLFVKDTNATSVQELIIGIVLFIVVIYLAPRNERVDVNLLIFGQPILFYINAVCGTMSVVLLCKNIVNLKLLGYLGKNSLIIMVTHLECYILLVSIRVSTLLCNLFLAGENSYVFYVCLALVLLELELITIYIINHYFYLLIGKKKMV